jgi:hypothetical protein
MPKRFTATEKWDDPWYRKLPNEYKCIWDYICSKCDMVGAWKVDFEMVSFCMCLIEIDQNKVLQQFNNGKERIRVLNCGSVWLVRDFVKFQYGVLKDNNNLHRSVISKLEVLGAVEGLNSPCGGDKVKVKVKVKGGMGGEDVEKFPPTVEMVTAYCHERKNAVSPQKFVDYYTSNGWMVGKNRMKNWRAAVRNWEARDGKTGASNTDFLEYQAKIEQQYRDGRISVDEKNKLLKGFKQ